MKTTVPFCFVFLLITACNNNNANIKNTSSDSTIAKKPTGYTMKQLTGVFYDTLPCANCLGIATKLYLKPDNSFIIERQYINKNTVYETGTWTMRDSLLQLNNRDSLEQYKIISSAELKVLDKDGKELTVNSKQLLLHRNNIPFKPVQPVPVEGNVSMENNAMNIHICTMQKTYPVKLAPTALLMEALYKKVAPKGETVYAKVAGHFELRPSFNNTTTQDFFIIEKFIKFIPNQACQ